MGFYRIQGGKVWKNGGFSQNQEIVYELPKELDLAIQLTEEDLVIPGIIDFHAHLWSPAAESPFGLAQEKHYAEGVLGGLDAGTYGMNDWEEAEQYWQNSSDLQIKSFVSLLPEGLTIFPPKTPTRPENINVDDYVELINRNKAGGTILGTKFQLGWLNYKSEETDTIMISKAREISDRTGTHMMIHTSGQCMKAGESAKYMLKDDIITHPYSGFPNTCLDEKGNVWKEVMEAKERGVLFDVGHAGKHFSWNVFKKAYAQGLKFDTIGGDLCDMNYRAPNWPIHDMYHVISGFLNYGIALDECFRAVIDTPCKYLGFTADLTRHCTILKKVYGETVSGDGLGETIPCSYEYRPVLVIHNGKLYRKLEKTPKR